MKLHFLGTGSSYPTTKRGVSSLALQQDDGSVWLFDSGEGTQIQAQKVTVSRQKINKIFITHLHGDHMFGLPGLLCTISSQFGLTEEQLKKEVPRVDIYGPKGLRRFIYTALSLSRSPLIFQYCVHEMVPVSSQYTEDWGDWDVDHSEPSATHPSELPGVTIEPSVTEDGNVAETSFFLTFYVIFHFFSIDNDEWCVQAGWIHHRVPSFGFVINERDRAGTLDKSKLMSLGVKPGPVYGQLKSGKSITLENGDIITPEMVVGPPIRGRTLVILGDTSDASPLAHMIKSCDVVVHEATHDDNLMDKAAEFGHSTPSQAVAFAKGVNAKVLLLNHFSQRYSPSSKESLKEGEETVALLEEQAQAAAAGSGMSVQCADDFFVYEVPGTGRASMRV
ncbi:zinc phosphodiesterase ELAC protein 1-like [Penaeus japonicus]|uniref:zinc phosphodiesterase ELAC protein 1-like n=1 Tax=Penaeus japonicus TaxID=27405 RepID=UPI001C71652A|nr:zinc phosphodiesterase ELAC protein 1-like [Penaeus japonicus]